MNNNFDLCIVGAGMIGSAAARHASMNPAINICLIGPAEIEPDRWEEVNREIFSSHYDEGRITRSFDDDDYLRLFGVKSIERYRELEKVSGISFYNDVGCMYMGTINDKFIKSVQEGMESNLFHYKDLSSMNAFKTEFPFLRKLDDELAFLDKNGAGHISPRKMVKAQQIVASKQGCHIIPEVVNSIDEFKIVGEKFFELITESGKKLYARKVLLCTNAFTNFRKLLPKEVNITIIPETVAMLKIDEIEAERLCTMPSIIYRRRATEDILKYILPPIKYPDGNWYLKTGGMGTDEKPFTSLHVIKDWYLSKGSETIMKEHAEALKKIIIDLQVVSVTPNSCVDCYTLNGLPYISNVADSFSVAIAGNGKGAKWSDEVGRIASKLAISGEWDSDAPQSKFLIQWK